MKVKTTNYENNKNILRFPDHYVGSAVMVSDAGIIANEDGKKIVPAGTLIGESSTGAVTPKNDATTEGVLLMDTDVTYGKAPGTMIIHGFIDTVKIPAQPSTAALEALPMVKFL